jgi:hypothetical protein
VLKGKEEVSFYYQTESLFGCSMAKKELCTHLGLCFLDLKTVYSG